MDTIDINSLAPDDTKPKVIPADDFLANRGFNKLLYKNPPPDMPNVGGLSTPVIGNSLDDTLNGSQFADNGIPAQKVQPSYQTVTQAILSLTIGHGVLTADTTANAVTFILPSARLALGHAYLINLQTVGGTNKVTISCTSPDKFGGAGGQGAQTNGTCQLSAKSDFLYLCATNTNTWLVLAAQGTTFSA